MIPADSARITTGKTFESGVPAVVPCCTLWVGPAIGAVERACFRSVLRQGHPMVLYCYAEPEGVPDGVEVRDAGDVLPQDRIIRHHTGSVSLFSNWFRYELQRRSAGVWLDADVYLVKPLPDEPHLYGYYEPGLINGAVLRLPSDSPVLGPLIEIFDEKRVPSWLTRRERWEARANRLRTGRTNLAGMRWGTAGPHALTALLPKFGLDRWAREPEVFYPVPYENAEWIADPNVDAASVVTPATIAIHLWNERIKHIKDGPAPPGSFLARLLDEGRAGD